MHYSFWEKHFLEQPSDVTIIGSGIVGLSTAISVKEAHPLSTVKVLERGTHPYGASTRNAGFACIGSVSELMEDVSVMGWDATMQLVDMRWKGLARLRQRVGDKALAYIPCGGIEIFRKNDSEVLENCRSSMDICNQRLASITGTNGIFSMVRNQTLSSFHEEAVLNACEGTIDPLRMMHTLHAKAVSLGVHIVYGIEVTDIDRSARILITSTGLAVAYRRLVICTNGFTRRFLPQLDVVPARNQVIITDPLPGNPLSAAYTMDQGYVYFREVNGRVLLGGGRHLDKEKETTDQFGETDMIQSFLRDFLELLVPGASAHIAHRWSGILGVGPSRFPLLQWVDPAILAGVRMGGMGVAIGSHMGDRLADMIVEA